MRLYYIDAILVRLSQQDWYDVIAIVKHSKYEEMVSRKTLEVWTDRDKAIGRGKLISDALNVPLIVK